MISSSEIISLIKGFSLSERLKVVEEILRNIREENLMSESVKEPDETDSEPTILQLAGIMDDQEAQQFSNAVEESRKIDRDEW